MKLTRASSPSYISLVDPVTGAVKFVPGTPHDGNACRACGKRIPVGRAYCWLDAFFGGQRKISKKY